MEFGTTILGIHFLTGDLTLLAPYAAEYSMPLVALSYLFAFAGSFAGLSVSRQLFNAKSRVEWAFWLVSGSAALGGAVWSMHFIAMLAYRLPFDVSYNIAETIVSAVPSIGASVVALYLLSRKTVSRTSIALGGLLIGAGIGAMHFTGMGAMRANASMGYDPALFALSIVVAVILAIVALSAQANIARLVPGIPVLASNAVAALIMGAAISGMHYTAMTAVTFFEGSLCARGGATIDANRISDMGFYVMFVFVVLVLMGAIARQPSTKSALLGAILDNSREGIVVSNARGSITLFSPAAERILGYSAPEILGRHVSALLPLDFTHQDNASRLEEAEEMQMKFSGKEWETQAKRKDGTLVDVEVGTVELHLGGETIYSATIRDIAPRKELERAQFHALMEVSNALDHQKELNEAQREFVAMVSHEFRTPLAIIDSAAQRLLRHKDHITPEKIVQRIDTIREAISNMTDLIGSTLSAERMDSGTMLLELEDIDPRKVVGYACRRQRELTGAAEITTDLEGLPACMHVDGVAVDQIFTNLVSNAVKYCEGDAVVRITGWQEGDDAVIEVADEGLGIDDEDLPRMFTRFFRAKTSAGIPGTGIGLHLVKRLVEAHGGSIDLQSEKGVGTTFTVRLPMGQEAPRCAPATVRVA